MFPGKDSYLSFTLIFFLSVQSLLLRVKETGLTDTITFFTILEQPGAL